MSHWPALTRLTLLGSVVALVACVDGTDIATDDDDDDATATDTGESTPDPVADQCDEDARRWAPPSIELAPEIWAEPLDALRVEALVELDAELGQGHAEATLEFRAGPEGQLPIFDLRQTNIESVELDGQALAPDRIGLYPIYPEGGVNHRILEAIVEPCSVHELTLSYAIATPAAIGAHAVVYIDDRVAWNFDFNDMHSGRFLESWLPVGLYFDRFELELELELHGTAREHDLLTTGDVVALGASHWSVHWPDVASDEPMLILDAADRWSRHEGSHETPDGAAIRYQIWISGDDAEPEQRVLAALGAIDDFVVRDGAYPHDRLAVHYAHLNNGIPWMEYRGGYSAAADALVHETYHQWWGRGVGPARPSDGWFDEGWVSYYADQDSHPELHFEDPPIELLDPHPYAGQTTTGAHVEGARVFELLAREVGAEALHAAMNELRVVEPHARFDTQTLERHLYCSLGEASSVRAAFHRFVRGQEGEPEAAADDWCG